MPRRSRLGRLAGEKFAAENIKRQREARGWSTAALAKAVTEAGCPISQTAVWRIENAEPRRKISVDELIAFAEVFSLTLSDLLSPNGGEPPLGLLRLYVNRLVDAAEWADVPRRRESVATIRMAAAMWEFPQAEREISEMLAEVTARLAGPGRGGSMLSRLSLRLDDRLTEFHQKGKSDRMLGPLEIIAYGQEVGMTKEEIKDFSEQWSVGETVSAWLDAGVVYFTHREEEFWAPVERLVIADGLISVSAECGDREKNWARGIANLHGFARIPWREPTE